jgi:hypothetical protein
MDDKRSLLSYIGPGPVLVLVCVLLLAATLTCAFYTPPAVEYTPQYPPPVPVGTPFFDTAEDGSAAMLDTIAVSDAICVGADGRLYYAAENDFHNFYIVCVSGETYALMGPQRDLWLSPDAPASYIRLTGTRTPIPEEVKQGFLEVFAMDAEVFDNTFGPSCLVEEIPVVPDNSRSPAWTVCAVIFALGFLATSAALLAVFLPAWAALVRLEEREGLSDAAQQLDGAKELRNGRLRLSKDFLFGGRIGLAAAWEDVLWCYERSLSLGSKALCHLLVICTADAKTHCLLFPGSSLKELRRVANTLNERNPKMLWGFTPENAAAWKERTE